MQRPLVSKVPDLVETHHTILINPRAGGPWDDEEEAVLPTSSYGSCTSEADEPNDADRWVSHASLSIPRLA
jgi:hypothetical protein